MSNPLLQIQNLQFSYGGKSGRGIGPLSFELRPREIVVLLGRSGCGKTTLLRVIAGVLPRSGDAKSGAFRWSACGEISRFRVSLMFQQTVLLPHLDAVQNVLLPFGGDCRSDHRDYGVRLLCELGLERELGMRPDHLSGGMRTRVALARALVVRPTLLLLDEPFSGIDVVVREQAYRVLERFRDEGGTCLIVTHDVEEAWRLRNRALVMSDLTQLQTLSDSRTRTFTSFRDELMAVMERPQ